MEMPIELLPFLAILFSLLLFYVHWSRAEERAMEYQNLYERERDNYAAYSQHVRRSLQDRWVMDQDYESKILSLWYRHNLEKLQLEAKHKLEKLQLEARIETLDHEARESQVRLETELALAHLELDIKRWRH